MKIKWWAVAISVIVFIAITYVNIFTTNNLLSMTEAELFENLIKTFVIFESFHPSVASFIAIFSVTVLWILWLAYVICCIDIVNKWLKERHNDT